jgi:hypothetical protein
LTEVAEEVRGHVQVFLNHYGVGCILHTVNVCVSWLLSLSPLPTFPSVRPLNSPKST